MLEINQSPLQGVGGRPIELLSPAKNLECGLTAINHGADAVYIGASKFGARANAGNSIQDIEELAKYAHKFNARVYAAVNTILMDDELEDAQKQIWQLYEAGADAIIVQDMGILQMDLPPIALHASTQTDNRTVEKVKFLQDVGFSQVVLARELSLHQIKEISSQTTVSLEFFVHGALCVCYSGQCYISAALSGGRSANRGECAQYCRLPYDLLDANGEVVMKSKHLLSLKDMNLSNSLEDLIDAGVSSLKIEGRLKEADYVKNITAYYRQKLDAILEGSSKYKKASSGKTTFMFTPNPEKSFHRGSTNYFLYGRNAEIASFDTPKSVGEQIGRVTEIGKNYLYINTKQTLNNGDGLCFLNPHGEFSGFRVNRVDEARVYPHDMHKVSKGTMLYRNLDVEFEKILSKKSSERKIAIDFKMEEIPSGFKLSAMDKDGNTVSAELESVKELAKNEQMVEDNIRTQLSKLGTTDFYARDISISISQPYFIPSSQLAELRRALVENLELKRSAEFKRLSAFVHNTSAIFPKGSLSYLGNVSNRLAREFYSLHGVSEIEQAFELETVKNVPLMFTKHCIKYNLGLCPNDPNAKAEKSSFAYSLRYKDTILDLKFDCANCEMLVSKQGY